MSGGIASVRRMVVTISPIVAEASRASMTAGTRFADPSRRDRDAVESSEQPREIPLAFEGFNCPDMAAPSFDLGRGDVAQQRIVLLGQLVHVDANHGDIAVLDVVLRNSSIARWNMSRKKPPAREFLLDRLLPRFHRGVAENSGLDSWYRSNVLEQDSGACPSAVVEHLGDARPRDPAESARGAQANQMRRVLAWRAEGAARR